MIVDASLVIDVVADPGPRGRTARATIAAQPGAVKVLSGLRAPANRSTHPLEPNDLAQALREVEAFGVGLGYRCSQCVLLSLREQIIAPTWP